MHLVHLSDTHLGYSAYKALDTELGLNQREADLNRAFSSAIDKILSLKPQVVLHTGDLFDSVRPSNRAIAFALKELLRLPQAGIATVIICGNHSTPRLKDTGSIFQLLELFPDIYPVHTAYKKIQLGQLIIHAVPHCSTGEELANNLARIKVDDDGAHHVLMLHAVLAGTPDIPNFSMGEFNELEVSTALLDLPFKYIALGHFHKFTELSENACYAGSLERLSFNEVGQEKGFLEVELPSGRKKFHPIKTRPMIDLGVLDAGAMDSAALMAKLDSLLEYQDFSGKIARLTIENISPSTYRALDFARIRQLTAPALHFEIRYRQEEASPVEPPPATISGILCEFREYVSRLAIEDLDKEKIASLGEELLQKSEELS